MKQETFLIVGITTILTMAFFLGGRDKSCAQRLFTSTDKEYKFISIEMAEQQTDTLTTNY
jgi:hypothetical protein